MRRLLRIVTWPLALLALWLAARARNAGRWHDAVRLYPVYLAFRPDSARIWVQLGNVQKDTGDPGSAEHSYLKALALDGGLADAHAQLGHALQALGRIAEARAAFEEAARLGHPRARDAADRLPRTAGGRGVAASRANLPAPPPSPAPWRPDAKEPGGDLLLDVTDILEQVHNHGRATGIQRVQMGIAEPLLLDRDPRARFVFLERRLGPVRTLAPERFKAIIDYCIAEPFDLARAKALVADAKHRSWRTRFEGARAYVMLGAFWYLAGSGPLLARMKLAGLRIGTIVYDLIPLTHPEHTSADTVRLYTKALREGARWWDFATTISAFTAKELSAQLRRIGAPEMPVVPVPLAHRIGSVADAPRGEVPPLPPQVADLEGKPFVLCVGTIESRKNHAGLIQAWRVMLREGYEPPPLVLVGQKGWRVNDLLEQLEDTGFLGGRVRLVHGLSDLELEALYRNCAFSVFPSFTEGWGLPVGESLAFGKLCIASREGATPEAAGGFADLVDPYDVRMIADRVRYWADHPAELAEAEARIREGFHPRGWPEVTRNFMAEVEACLAGPLPERGPATLPILRPGEELRFDLPAQEVHPAPATAFEEGFEPPEEVCSWILGDAATLRFQLEGWTGEPELEVVVSGAPWNSGNAVALSAGAPGKAVARPVGPSETRVLRVRAVPDADNVVTLSFKVTGDTSPTGGDPRPIRVALIAIRAAGFGRARLPAGEALSLLPRPGTHADTDDRAAALLREGFSETPGPRGFALSAPEATLAFEPADAPAATLRVALHFRAAPDAPALRVATDGAPVDIALPRAGGDALAYLDAEAGEDGRVALRFEAEGKGPERIALAGLAWVPRDDLAARVALIEAMGGRAGLASGLPLADRVAAAEAALAREGLAEGPRLPATPAEVAASRIAAARG
jgi:glycosyltransferase involved in cell wall biosynthesis